MAQSLFHFCVLTLVGPEPRSIVLSVDEFKPGNVMTASIGETAMTYVFYLCGHKYTNHSLFLVPMILL